MDGPVRVPEMSVAPHHHPPHYAIDTRSPSIFTTTPLSPARTLSPILQRAQQEPVYSPDRAYFSPSRDSFISKPSVSEASHVPSSPSSASFNSEQHSRVHSNHAESSQRTNGHDGPHSNAHSPRRSRDVEKNAGSRSSNPTSLPGPSTVISEVTTVTYTGGPDQRDERRELESKALRILIYLAFFAPIISFLITCWSTVCLILFLLAQPLRCLIKTRPTPSSELATLLSPALRLQLRLITSSAESDTYSAPMLIVINLLSPFVAIGAALAAWTAAWFWFFSAILGDPAGRDGHNDGKTAVLGVRSWWERWLCRGLR
ncbi:hypothetical protein NA57DRAFT_78296 [Rhizodiscina lignyota]|uniref:Uncharacterized protein n=1 Tax=Rhizodiscina lignyota TaxID=1504668 RepID=A0A9P4IC76_9PEZI|nr:hypothetical protein NA57DRAFT_78296 [Rhizodiscina lignyota]